MSKLLKIYEKIYFFYTKLKSLISPHACTCNYSHLISISFFCKNNRHGWAVKMIIKCHDELCYWFLILRNLNLKSYTVQNLRNIYIRRRRQFTRSTKRLLFLNSLFLLQYSASCGRAKDLFSFYCFICKSIL